MNSYALAALLALTACAQTYSQTRSDGWRLLSPGMVAMPLEDLHLIHARRKVADGMLSERARVVVEWRGYAEAAQELAALRERERDGAKADMMRAIEEAGIVREENAKLSRRLKRMRPWATAMKVTVGVLVVTGGMAVYKSTIP